MVVVKPGKIATNFVGYSLNFDAIKLREGLSQPAIGAYHMREGKQEQSTMLSIEYVIARGRRKPSIVYHIETRAHTAGEAEQVAQGTLGVVRRMFPASPPNGFQIFDRDGELVSRSWEYVPPRFPVFASLSIA